MKLIAIVFALALSFGAPAALALNWTWQIDQMRQAQQAAKKDAAKKDAAKKDAAKSAPAAGGSQKR